MSQHEMRVYSGNGLFSGSVSALRGDTVVLKRDLLLKSKRDAKADLSAEENSVFGVVDWQP